MCVYVCTNRTAERCVVERPREGEEEEKKKKRNVSFADGRLGLSSTSSLFSLFLLSLSRFSLFFSIITAIVVVEHLLSFSPFYLSIDINTHTHIQKKKRSREKVGNDSTYAHSVYFSHFVLKYTITRLEKKTHRSSNYSCIT